MDICNFGFEEGSTYYPNGDIAWLAGIDVTDLSNDKFVPNRIQVSGDTEEEANELRDTVLAALKDRWYKELR